MVMTRAIGADVSGFFGEAATVTSVTNIEQYSSFLPDWQVYDVNYNNGGSPITVKIGNYDLEA